METGPIKRLLKKSEIIKSYGRTRESGVPSLNSYGSTIVLATGKRLPQRNEAEKPSSEVRSLVRSVSRYGSIRLHH